MNEKTLRVANAQLVPSPCTDVCRIDPVTGWCEGCLRTMDEIVTWIALNDPARREVWSRLPARRQAMSDARDTT